MKLVYVGPHAQVEVPELGILATPESDPVEVTGDTAQSLIATGQWAKQSAKADQTSAPADAVAPKE